MLFPVNLSIVSLVYRLKLSNLYKGVRKIPFTPKPTSSYLENYDLHEPQYCLWVSDGANSSGMREYWLDRQNRKVWEVFWDIIIIEGRQEEQETKWRQIYWNDVFQAIKWDWRKNCYPTPLTPSVWFIVSKFEQIVPT